MAFCRCSACGWALSERRAGVPNAWLPSMSIAQISKRCQRRKRPQLRPTLRAPGRVWFGWRLCENAVICYVSCLLWEA
jgi:hypothetical protein